MGLSHAGALYISVTVLGLVPDTPNACKTPQRCLCSLALPLLGVSLRLGFDLFCLSRGCRDSCLNCPSCSSAVFHRVCALSGTNCQLQNLGYSCLNPNTESCKAVCQNSVFDSGPKSTKPKARTTSNSVSPIFLLPCVFRCLMLTKFAST